MTSTLRDTERNMFFLNHIFHPKKPSATLSFNNPYGDLRDNKEFRALVDNSQIPLVFEKCGPFVKYHLSLQGGKDVCTCACLVLLPLTAVSLFLLKGSFNGKLVKPTPDEILDYARM